MLYTLKIHHSNGERATQERTVDRPDVTAASEDAMRWLRLTRNTTRIGEPKYDRWSVHQPTGPREDIWLAGGDHITPQAE